MHPLLLLVFTLRSHCSHLPEYGVHPLLLLVDRDDVESRVDTQEVVLLQLQFDML